MTTDKKLTIINIVVAFWVVIIISLLIINFNEGKTTASTPNHHHNEEIHVMPEHENLNHGPTPLEVTRDGSDVYIKMTAQITDIEINDGYTYTAWTFNGEAPGPLVVVEEGDTIHFTLENMDPAMDHSMDFHAVHTAPNKGFANVPSNEEGTFVYKASSPGVFMYHCGTDPALLHIANGMHGVMIVKPKDGYPTDDEVDREFVVIQNEWYEYNDIENMTNGVPKHVVFSTKEMHEGQANTNGTVGALINQPFQVKTGEKIRFYVANMGPNETSSFHVIGTLFDDVYIDGHPANHFEGMQTVGLPASGGAVVEFTIKEEGEYKFVTHQFNHVQKGAVGKIIAYDGDIPELPDPEEQSVESNNQLNIKATNFTFDKNEYVVKAGDEVTIKFTSTEGYHSMAIDDFDVHIQGSGEASFTPKKPGRYKIYCNVYCGSGHEQMISTLVVQ